MCVERCVLGISLIREAALKRMLAGYLVKMLNAQVKASTIAVYQVYGRVID